MRSVFGMVERVAAGAMAPALTIAIGVAPAPAAAEQVTVTIENLSSDGGLFFTPVWVGFHNGGFDVYDRGAPASPGLEAIAEDGVVDPIRAEFASSGAGVDGVVTAPAGFAGAPVFEPGETASATFTVDPGNDRYFSYASMIIPSNDAFFANGNPTAIELFDEDGDFVGPVSFIIVGADILDAGTEQNTEQDAAFINQTAPNTGLDENGTVQLHPGFIDSLGNPGGTPIILGGTTASGDTIDPILGDFTRSGFQVARITVVPEPTSAALAGLAGASLLLRRRPRPARA